ncbi:hypothetical protein TW65_07930 [Stemphylium lycopersici]|uniref:Rhodopsin domain-containing protein n=1 Tax=Stemphylium lycopersici TaxID=183478 RepID=A0A364MVS7_STELY|nr:hypothetical protein TW65_07930 [Stemphylium lycopersici]RAR05062.1 hypothetical protein DDE83_007555 [Stemphylium lycopersici]
MSAPAPKNITDLSPDIVAYRNGPVLLVQTTPAFAVAALVVLLRCYARARILKSFGTDDWVMIVTLVCYAVQIDLGVGKYVAVIQADPERYRRILMVRQIDMTAVVVGLSLCVPVEAAWDVRLRRPPMGTGTARCLEDATFHDIGTFNGGTRPQLTSPVKITLMLTPPVVHIITDFLLALIPVPLIWKLNMPLRTRMSLVVVLSLGIFAAIAGIVRQLSTADFLAPEPWIHDTYGVWNFIELYVGMIAASLPAIKPLFNWFFNAARKISKGTKTSRFSSRNEGAEQRRVQPWDTDGFVLQSYEIRDEERGGISQESILPRGDERGRFGGAVIASHVEVEDSNEISDVRGPG